VALPYVDPDIQQSFEPERTPPWFSGHAWLRGAAYIRKLGGNLVLMRPFDMPDAQTLRSACGLIADTRGLVLDLRGYPVTHFQHELARCLCREPVVSPRYEIPVVSNPDLDTRTWKLAQHTIQPDGRSVYDRPVVALIDETTQSSAEDFCMYLRIAHRVTFVGRPTAGCVGNLTMIDLPGGGWATFTGMRVTWPDGSPMWSIGIQPRIIVEPTLEGLKAGRDEVLEKGIEFLQSAATNEERNE
jgi:C-terminal processing protease CtpA/Prc